MINLAKAYTTAWQDLKAFGAKAVAFVAKETPAVNSVVKEVSTAAEIVDPALTPAITVFDTLEEEVVGYVAALASDTANATTLSGLFGSAWPTVQALVAQLEGHPAVVAAKATS